MPERTAQPELIISLSQDRVGVQLLPGPAQNRIPWQITHPITGLFASDQVSAIMDDALVQNPQLIDSFPCVHVLIMDRPNLCIPAYIAEGENLVEVAARHLRLRSGDVLTTDDPLDNNTICYSLPIDTMELLQEYYHTIGRIHIVSLLWKEIRESFQHTPKDDTISMYATLLDHQLIMLAERNGKLMFSKSFIVAEQDDVNYFTLAVKQLLKASRLCWITIRDQYSVLQEPREASLKFNDRITFASLPDLLAKSNPCVS